MAKGLVPQFRRGEVARILNVTPLTIANRERRQLYPLPARSANGYRVYSLAEVFELQLLTFHRLDPAPVISVLWDKGFRDTKEVGQLIDRSLSRQVPR